MMAEEPENPRIVDDPRSCPECGARVATMATTCLMCGADLEEGDEEAEPPEDAEKPRRRLRGWVRGLAAVGLALVMLAASVFALLSAMNAGERAETSESTPASTLTPAASPTARRTPTLRVSPTPVVTSTPVPPRSHQVQQGETLSEIAAEFEVAVAEILAMNPDVDPELLQVGQVLLIPPVAGASGSGALGLSDDPDATRADFVVHVVRPGEALLSIAEEYGVSVQSIRQANDLGPYEDTIKVNQSLVIPLSAPSPTPTPTANPNSTPTARPPYVAPPLLSPIDGEVLEGMKQPVVLQWASVGILRDDEWYAATLLQPAGGTVSATHYTRVTSWRLADDLLISANTDGREFIWWVRVVKERHADGGQVVYVEAGAPSEPRRFIWLGPTPTPSPTPASSP